MQFKKNIQYDIDENGNPIRIMLKRSITNYKDINNNGDKIKKLNNFIVRFACGEYISNLY